MNAKVMVRVFCILLAVVMILGLVLPAISG